MKDLINKIHNCDNREILKQLPDKSINLIILDPPYNIKKAKWDNYKKDKYIEFIASIFKECERVLKDNGSFYFFHNNFLQIVEIQNWINNNTKFIFKQLITWSKIDKIFKNNGFVQQRLSIDMMRNYYNGFTEYLLFYTFQDSTGRELIEEQFIASRNPFSLYLKSEFKKANVSNKEISKLFLSKTGGLTGCVSNWLNGDNVITKEQYLKIRNYLNNEYLRKEYEDLRKEYEDLRKEYEDLRKKYEDLRYTFNNGIVKNNLRSNSNVWIYENEKCILHPTQKPIKLIENIINHSSNEDDLIFDGFSGSGTTAIACHNTNRNFICCELEKGYYDKSIERLEERKEVNYLF